MGLKLTVVAQPEGVDGLDAVRLLHEGEKLRIGRGEDRNWVLSSQGVSRRHCFIVGKGNRFQLTDTSTYGVFIDDDDRPVGNNNTVDLRHGQYLHVGEFDILVEIEGESLLNTGANDHMVTVIEPPPRSLPSSPEEEWSPRWGADDERREPELYPAPGHLDEDWRRRRPPQSTPDSHPLNDHFEPPQPDSPVEHIPIEDGGGGRAGGYVLPSNLADVLSERSAKPSLDSQPPPTEPPPAIKNTEPEGMPRQPMPDASRGSQTPGLDLPPEDVSPEAIQHSGGTEAGRRAPAPPTTPPSTTRPPAETQVDSKAAQTRDAEALAAFFEGVGLRPGSIQAADPFETMRTLGEVFFKVVDSTIRLLDARREIKGMLGMDQTIFEKKDDNPLKWSRDARHAVELLLDTRENSYLPAKEAFAEAFTDIANHEYALLEGVRDAWRDLLSRVDPETLEERVGSDKGVAAMISSRKARCWDILCERHREILEDKDRIFAARVATAYEKRESKGHRRKR